VHRFPRHTETALSLRTHGHIFHVPSKSVPKETVQFVPAVVTNLLTKKARIDAHPDEWLTLLNRLF
jgi:hypothetical protein